MENIQLMLQRLPDLPTELPQNAAEQLLLEQLDQYRDRFTGYGESHARSLMTMSGGSKEEKEALIYHFEFCERAKQFLICYRDILFQHLRGVCLLADNRIEPAQLARHWQESIETLTGAVYELQQTGEQRRVTLLHQEKQISAWRLQDSPWPIYQEQFAAITEQATQLVENKQQTLNHIEVFQKIRLLVLDHVQKQIDQLSILSEQIQKLQQLFASQQEMTTGQISRKLIAKEESFQVVDQGTEFKAGLGELMDRLPEKWQVFTNTDQGMLLSTETELRKRVGQWLENQIFPILYETWELIDSAQNACQMAVSNLKNRLQLLTQNEPSVSEIPEQPFVLLVQQLDAIQHEMRIHQTTILDRLQKQFYLTYVFHPEKVFLPTLMQFTVRQLDQATGKVSEGLANSWKLATKRLRRILSQVEQEEGLGYTEKTARYIDHRRPLASSHAYTSIFLTKGFIGSSFATGRREEMDHLAYLFRQWEKGYRGAVLLTGRRFCGKTFLGEWAAYQHFQTHVIRLSPDQETVIQGRKLPATTKILDVLNFLKKHAFPLRPLVWIDDLELWQDAGHSFYDNVTALIHFIDRYADRCFFMVATNHWCRQRLRTLFRIDEVFQATLHLDTMPTQDIAHALLIRHGATHQKMLSDDSDPARSAKTFQSVAAKVGKAAHGNIGEALMWWTASVRSRENGTIHLDFSDKYSLPELPNPEMLLILEELLWQKRTDEYRLRKQFGPAFAERYVHLLRRMLSIGLIQRLADGKLEIEESVVNAIGGFEQNYN